MNIKTFHQHDLPNWVGHYIVLASDEWWINVGDKKWRRMTVREQIEASK